MKNLYYIIILLLLVTNKITAKTDITYNFTTKNGLTNNSIISLFQDERDFIWIGTRNGLCIYNGKTFETHKNINQFGNEIKNITGNKNGEVYIHATNIGLSVYDIKKDTVKSFNIPKITSINYYKRLIISNTNSLFYFDKELKIICKLPKHSHPITCINEINDSIFIGTENGMYLFDKSQKIKKSSTKDL